MTGRLMIYGAYGYTGALIARQAVARGLTPVLAGRDSARLADVAGPLGCDTRAFALDAVGDNLNGVAAVIHAAGPFRDTAAPMLAACLAAGVHYMDITGEALVFNACAKADQAARDAGVTVLPGVGFDVVPSDCLAAMLAAQLPGAVRLELAFGGIEQASRGTMKTAQAGLGMPTYARRAARLVPWPDPPARQIDLGDGPVDVVPITWGDLVTAFHSTGIPDIEVWTLPGATQKTLGRLPGWALRLLGGPLAPALHWWIGRQPAGPDDAMQARIKARLWGRVTDAQGRSRELRLQTVEPYLLTALTAVAAAERIMAGNVPVGFQTPSRAFGADFILSVPGCALQDRGGTA